MKDLAFKEKDYDCMYPSCATGKKEKRPKRYPSVTLPLSLYDKKEMNLDDEVTLIVKGKITRIEQSKYSEDFTVELKQGEIKDEDNKTIAG